MIIVHYKYGVTTRSLHLTRAAQLALCPGANIFLQGVRWLSVQLPRLKYFLLQKSKIKALF